MPSPSLNLNRMVALARARAKLEARFSEFPSAASDALNNELPITISAVENSAFSASFCGHTAQFKLNLRIGNGGAPEGLVTCFVAASADGLTPLTRLFEFSFGASGSVKLEKPADHEDPLQVNDPQGALYLVALPLMKLADPKFDVSNLVVA